jgi:hypothetical protein
MGEQRGRMWQQTTNHDGKTDWQKSANATSGWDVKCIFFFTSRAKRRWYTRNVQHAESDGAKCKNNAAARTEPTGQREYSGIEPMNTEKSNSCVAM